MSRYRLIIQADERIYWPCWPFRVDRLVLRFARGFRLHIEQRDGLGWTDEDEAIEVQGYVSTDGELLTTTVNFQQGSRLKRVTRVQR